MVLPIIATRVGVPWIVGISSVFSRSVQINSDSSVTKNAVTTNRVLGCTVPNGDTSTIAGRRHSVKRNHVSFARINAPDRGKCRTCS